MQVMSGIKSEIQNSKESTTERLAGEGSRRALSPAMIRLALPDYEISRPGPSDCARGTTRAFTLIEMLVVIAVIAILASLIFPVAAGVQRARIRRAAQAQMEQVATAIEEYHTKKGFYPPDNGIPNPSGFNYGLNQLYYELVGTVLTNNTYQTLNHATSLPVNQFPGAFDSTKVQTFLNTTQNPGSDDVQSAVNFMQHIKSGQYLLVKPGLPNPNPTAPVMVLGTTLTGPVMYTDSSGNKINPWYYNSSNPTNNTGSYDLWTDVLVGTKTNRICNWNSKPLVF